MARHLPNAMLPRGGLNTSNRLGNRILFPASILLRFFNVLGLFQVFQPAGIFITAIALQLQVSLRHFARLVLTRGQQENN
jgi:hypothetical protein